jgi:hypothetical protein
MRAVAPSSRTQAGDDGVVRDRQSYECPTDRTRVTVELAGPVLEAHLGAGQELPTIADEFYRRHLALKGAWDNGRRFYAELPAHAQWDLHAYYQPSKDLTREMLLKHRRTVAKERPELAAGADRAFKALCLVEQNELEVARQRAANPAPPAKIPKSQRTIRVRGLVHPEPDAQKLAFALIELAEQMRHDRQEPRQSSDLLREAGSEVPMSRGRRQGGRAGPDDGRQRAKAVRVEDVKDYVLGLKGTFVLTDIIKSIGGSQATVRRAVEQLIEAGQVEKLAPASDWHGRGRAPLRYSRS